MQFLLSIIVLISTFAPVLARPNRVKLSDLNSNQKHISYDQDAFKDISKRKKSFVGDYIDYVIDYGFEHKDHFSKKKKFFHDNDGHFYLVDDKLTTTTNNSRNRRDLFGATAADARGNKRVLVVPVGDPNASRDSFMWTDEFIKDALFSNTGSSLNTYYKEVSSDRVSFFGQMREFLVVDGLCQGGNIFDNGGADFLIRFIDEEVDLSRFDMVSFVFPDDDNCLGGALGVGTVGLVRYTNPFGNATKVGFNFNKSAGASIGNDIYFLKVVTHEFGHNFGLDHDNASTCGEDIFDGECESMEYGGVHSIMGFSPNLAHVNAIQQHDLEWLTDDQVLILDEASINREIDLRALASSNESSVKAVKIKRNDGSYYTVEYRSPIGMETKAYANQTLDYGGVQIYLNNDNHKKDSVLIRKDFKVFDPSSRSEVLALFDQTTFKPNELFYDSVSDIRITPLRVSSQQATILIEKAVEDGSSGGGVTSGEDPFIETVSAGYSLNSTGLTRRTVGLRYVGEDITNAQIRVSIPKAYRKLIKLKKRQRRQRLIDNQANFDFKFANLERFSRKLTKNLDEQYSVEIIVKIIDESSKDLILKQRVSILLDEATQ
jgi:M6 family metalloprotease-like protein